MYAQGQKTSKRGSEKKNIGVDSYKGRSNPTENGEEKQELYWLVLPGNPTISIRAMGDSRR